MGSQSWMFAPDPLSLRSPSPSEMSGLPFDFPISILPIKKKEKKKKKGGGGGWGGGAGDVVGGGCGGRGRGGGAGGNLQKILKLLVLLRR